MKTHIILHSTPYTKPKTTLHALIWLLYGTLTTMETGTMLISNTILTGAKYSRNPLSFVKKGFQCLFPLRTVREKHTAVPRGGWN